MMNNGSYRTEDGPDRALHTLTDREMEILACAPWTEMSPATREALGALVRATQAAHRDCALRDFARPDVADDADHRRRRARLMAALPGRVVRIVGHVGMTDEEFVEMALDPPDARKERGRLLPFPGGATPAFPRRPLIGLLVLLAALVAAHFL